MTTVKLRGHTYKLHSGCTVFVGVPEDHTATEEGGEGGYYIKFTRNDAVTKVRISDAAYECLIAAKAEVDIIKNTSSVVRFRLEETEEDVAALMDSVYVESPPRDQTDEKPSTDGE